MNNILPNNKISTLKEYALLQVGEVYDARETRNIVNEIFRHYLKLSSTDLIIKANDSISESELLLVYKAVKRLANKEPLQYVIGRAYFIGMDLHVSPAVLIPRPETEELVRLVLETIKPNKHSVHSVLDIGTGSGAIALALKKSRPTWNVSGLDVSQEALAIALKNSNEFHLEVEWKEVDILEENFPKGNWTCIVSNPPYIPVSEGSKMRPSVVEHEPHLALFVPENDPLLFYRRILQLSSECSTVKHIFFEIHENYSDETLALGESMGWKGELKKDLQGKPRMVYFTK